MRRLVDLFYLALYRLFALAVDRLSAPARVKLAGTLGRLAWRVGKKRRRVVERNLDFAFEGALSDEQKERIGTEAYANLIMTVFTVMRLEKIAAEELLDCVSIEGAEIVEKLLGEGRKIVFFGAHYGNWELVPPAMALHFGIESAVVGRKLDSEAMDALLKKSRERFGVELIYKHGATKGCMQALAKGKYLGLLVDQKLPKKHAVEATFFGKKVTHTPLASILAYRFDAALVPVYITTDDHIRHTLKILPPLKLPRHGDREREILEATQMQADTIEKIVREKPELWFWMHKRWKSFYPELYDKEAGR